MNEIIINDFPTIKYDLEQINNDKILLSDMVKMIICSPHDMPYSKPIEHINITVRKDEVKPFKLHDFYRSEYKTFPLFIAYMEDVTIYSPLMIGFKNGKLLKETIPPWRRDNLYFFDNLSLYKKCKEIIEIDEMVFVLANYSHTNYWHWITQCLVNLEILKHTNFYDKVKFLIPTLSIRYISETLNLLKIPKEKLLISGMAQIKLKKIIYPSFLEEHSNGRFSPVILDIFSELKHAGKKSKNKQSPKYIYFSRLDTNARKLKNEKEFITALQENGFDIITCTDLSIIEQINIVANAKMIVSLHGAALTNIGFTNRNCKVFEIIPQGWGVSCFYSLTRMRYQKHYIYIANDIDDITKGHMMQWTINITDVIHKIEKFKTID